MNHSESMTAFLVVGLLVGLAMIVGPFFVPAIPPASQVTLAGFGAAVALLFGILVVVTRLYHKTAADEAFVRTGVGGRRCIIDGGAIVIPVVHEIIPVSLRTFKLQIDRTGPDALITADFLRADVKAVFYIRVQKEEKAIEQAATSLGAILGDAHSVQNLIQEKLVSALRTVAATQTLHALNAKRAEFAEAVQKIVAEDLKPNGLTLESVTISSLDQAPLESMRPEENVFDAEGARTIAEKVQSQRVARNTIQREADQKVKEQDVRTTQYLAQQDIVEAKAKADAESEITMNRAQAEQRAKTLAAEQARLAGIAAGGVRAADRAGQGRADQAPGSGRPAARAGQGRGRRGETTDGRVGPSRPADRHCGGGEEPGHRGGYAACRPAGARDGRSAGQDGRGQAHGGAGEGEGGHRQAGPGRAAEDRAADGGRRGRLRPGQEGRGRADGRRQTGPRQVALAESEKQAKLLEAEGDQALQMVPVSVAREQVNVEDARVTVKIRDLEGQSRFESIARELQVQLATIEAEKEAKIAAAKAMGEAMSKANLTVWGDPGALERVTSAFFKGQAIGAFGNGLSRSLSPELAELVKRATGVELGGHNGAEPVVELDGKARSEA